MGGRPYHIPSIYLSEPVRSGYDSSTLHPRAAIVHREWGNGQAKRGCGKNFGGREEFNHDTVPIARSSFPRSDRGWREGRVGALRLSRWGVIPFHSENWADRPPQCDKHKAPTSTLHRPLSLRVGGTSPNISE